MARLGRRRRACQAAISSGEPHGGEEPEIPEWELLTAIALRNGERRELKHLSTGRKRKRM